MKVEAQITVYEIDGGEDMNAPPLVIRSHWNRNGHAGLVCIQTPDGKIYTVATNELERSIKSCTGLK